MEGESRAARVSRPDRAGTRIVAAASGTSRSEASPSAACRVRVRSVSRARCGWSRGVLGLRSATGSTTRGRASAGPRPAGDDATCSGHPCSGRATAHALAGATARPGSAGRLRRTGCDAGASWTGVGTARKASPATDRCRRPLEREESARPRVHVVAAPARGRASAATATGPRTDRGASPARAPGAVRARAACRSIRGRGGAHRRADDVRPGTGRALDRAARVRSASAPVRASLAR